MSSFTCWTEDYADRPWAEVSEKELSSLGELARTLERTGGDRGVIGYALRKLIAELRRLRGITSTDPALLEVAHQPTDIEADSSREAAEQWVADRWFGLGGPEEVRVHVRYGDGERVERFDVHADGDVTFYTMEVPSDEELAEIRRKIAARKAQP